MTKQPFRFILSLLMCLSIPLIATAQTVDIPDPNLRAAIKQALGSWGRTSVTVADMARLTSLIGPNAHIRVLTGLEHATNLRVLNLGAEYIEAEERSINSNSVSDISPIAGLTNLTTLNLTNNSVADISPIAGLTKLTWLYLTNNSVTDISPIAGLTNLKTLSLINNSVADISPIAGLTKLKKLYLNSNSIADISPVAGLTKLTVLILTNNSVTDISPIVGLTNLTTLNLTNNSVTDISPVAGLTKLTVLNLTNNSVTDISPIAGLTNLTWLYLKNNSIADISPVAGLTKLTVLNLNSNSVIAISSVAGLTNLTTLNLTNNSIADISPLLENTGLGSEDRVWLRRNPLSYPSLHAHLPTLLGRGVDVVFDDRTPTTLVKISGDDQKGVSGETLDNPFTVEVQDQRNSAFAGILVTFTVTAGGGTLSVTSITTDENGRAESTLTLGSDAGINTISVSAAGLQQPVSFNAVVESIEFDLSVPAGTSLIHIPLKPTAVDGVVQSITSIADLYDVLGGADTVNFLITHDAQTREWRSYFGTWDKSTSADVALTDDTGIIAGMKAPVSLRLQGDALGTDGSSIITLTPGSNLVGLPLRDSSIAHVSDLFTLEGIEDNVSVIILTDNGEFKAVGQAGDPGDIEISGGQSFILTAQRAATVGISGDGWTNISGTGAAPPIAMTGIKVEDTTPILALRGSIVDEGTVINLVGIRVTAKNLSTNSAIATVTGKNETGYRLTIVDIERERAATIGDTLEISAQSPHPFIGVKPLRYNVTAEDVKRSWIQLPTLGAYEIPAETQLLVNYPNPFNPETWIPYRLAEDAFVTLTIYDTAGRVIRALDVGHQVAAVYESRSKAAYWDGRNEVGEHVASGVYFYQLFTGDFSATRKMLIVK